MRTAKFLRLQSCDTGTPAEVGFLSRNLPQTMSKTESNKKDINQMQDILEKAYEPESPDPKEIS